MGDNISVEDRKSFEQKLQFVQKVDDQYFGLIDIYRFKEPPYEYIMDYQKTFIEGDPRYTTYTSFLQKLRTKQHKNLSKIHFNDIRNEIHMCIKDTKIHTFCNYYNFTLKQAIEKKKLRDSRFSEAQLVYIFGCLLDLGVYLKGFGLVVGDWRGERVFLSPEGYVKVYTVQLDKDNRNTAYYKALVDKSLVDELILSPEQLTFLNKMQYQPKLDIFKADLFAIAMIILELMTLDKMKFYYNEDKTGYKMGRVGFSLSSHNGEYSGQFMEIMRGCLMENPKDRMEMEQALAKIEDLRKKSQNVSYCIRLHQDDENIKKKQGISAKGQYILTGIEKRLTPSPITTLASSSSSGFSRHTSSQSQTQNQSHSQSETSRPNVQIHSHIQPQLQHKQFSR